MTGRWSLDVQGAPTSTVLSSRRRQRRSKKQSSRPDDRTGLPIAEVAQRTGLLSSHTLRHYEKTGLIAGVRRTAGGQRRYEADDLDWLTFLLRLRDTGMSIANMKLFASLRRR